MVFFTFFLRCLRALQQHRLCQISVCSDWILALTFGSNGIIENCWFWISAEGEHLARALLHSNLLMEGEALVGTKCILEKVVLDTAG